MARLEMLLMTGMNFAGGSEFATVNLWAEPLPILLIATITFMIKAFPAVFLVLLRGMWKNLSASIP